mgnify:CR=1 FL=1
MAVGWLFEKLLLSGVPMIEGKMLGDIFAAPHPQQAYSLYILGLRWISFQKRFFHLMLDRGVYLAPSMYEAGFVSSTHSDQVIDDTLTAARESLQAL